jgi:HSP20 family molecular chaperone IbpA
MAYTMASSEIVSLPNYYRVVTPMPWASVRDLTVDMEDRVLSITAQRSLQLPVTEQSHGIPQDMLVIDRVDATVERDLELPDDVDERAVSAFFRDGVLTVIVGRLCF